MADALSQLGGLLVDRGVLSPAALERAFAEPPASESRFLSRLMESEQCTEGDLVSVLAERQGQPGVDLSGSCFLLEVLDLVPRPVAETDLILPLSTEGDRLHVAVTSPEEAAATIDEVRFITGKEVSIYVAIAGPLEQAIASAYDARERGEALWHGSALDFNDVPGLAIVQPTGALPTPAGGVESDEIRAAVELEEIDLSDTERPAPVEAHSHIIDIEIGDENDEGEEIEVLESVRAGPKRILVVDDEPDILRLCSRALQSKGYAVDTALEGEEAERKLNKGEPPDLVLLDAMLPHVHGFEICQRIKSNPRLRGVQVVMMSAVYRGWRFAQDARESYGADDYLEKPFHLADLLRRVEERLAAGRPPAQPKKEAERLYKLGMETLEAGRLTDARTALEGALREDPYSPRVHFALARTLSAQGDVYRAITFYEKAVELRPNLFPALRNLAALYLEKGFRRKAAETLERALQVAPDPATREQIRTSLLKLL